MIGELLLFLLIIPVFIIIAIAGVVAALYPKRKWLEKNKKYLAKVNYSLDQTANVFGRDLFNWLFIKNNTPHSFGNPDETISSVLGKNKLINNLTCTGRFIDKMLGKNHTLNSIEKDE